MSQIKILKTLDKPIAELPELAPLIGKKVEIIVREQEEAAGDRAARRIGFLKGKIRMSPDFDEPLEDFKDYM